MLALLSIHIIIASIRDQTSFIVLSRLFVSTSKSNYKPFSVRFLLRRSDRSSHSIHHHSIHSIRILFSSGFSLPRASSMFSTISESIILFQFIFHS